MEAPQKNSRYDVNMTVGPHGPHGPHGGLHAITPPRNGPHAYKIPNANPDRHIMLHAGSAVAFKGGPGPAEPPMQHYVAVVG